MTKAMTAGSKIYRNTPWRNKLSWGVVIITLLSGLYTFAGSKLWETPAEPDATMVSILENAPPYSIIEYTTDQPYYQENGFFRFGIVCRREGDHLLIAGIGLNGSSVCTNPWHSSIRMLARARYGG